MIYLTCGVAAGVSVEIFTGLMEWPYGVALGLLADIFQADIFQADIFPRS